MNFDANSLFFHEKPFPKQFLGGILNPIDISFMTEMCYDLLGLRQERDIFLQRPSLK